MGLLLLSWREGARRPFALLLLCGLGLIGSTLVSLGLGLSQHIPALLAQRMRAQEDEHIRIDIHPPPPQQTMAGISFERSVIASEDVAWLRALPGVTGSMVLHAVPVPTTVFVRVPGLLDSNQFLALYGIEADDMPQALRAHWQQADDAGPIPAVMNPDVITYYNLGMADRYGLPRLSPTILEDRDFDLLVGRDIFRSLDGAFRSSIRLVGYNGVVNPWGVALPKQVTDRFLDRLFPEGHPGEAAPVQVRLFVESAEHIDDLRRRIQERGLTLAEAEPLAAMLTGISALGRNLVALLAFILFLVVVGACASLAAGLISERRRQVALYRLAGAGIGQLLIIFAGTLSAALALATLLGTALAALLLPDLIAPLADLLQVSVPADSGLVPATSWVIAPLAAVLCGLLATAPPLLLLGRRPLLALLREG